MNNAAYFYIKKYEDGSFCLLLFHTELDVIECHLLEVQGFPNSKVFRIVLVRGQEHWLVLLY